MEAGAKLTPCSSSVDRHAIDNDNSSEVSSEDELRNSDGETRDVLPSSKKKFSSKQQAVLSAFYNTGMKGVGEVYSGRILQAAKEAGLKIDQVKV